MKSFLILFFTILFFPLFSQQKSEGIRVIANEIIVQLEEGTNASAFFQKIKTESRASGVVFKKEKQFSKMLNMYLLKTEEDIKNVKSLLQNIESHPEVKGAGQNFQMQRRDREPNDPQFTSQWNLDIINAPAVWDVTTGGVTPLGDTIVVAMMESGDWTHPDLIGNHWINRGEIEDDGIDNDGNGYVDDYHGWNIVNEDDEIGFDFDFHGTRVGGIIGATGDNNMGVAGINWNVKIMWIHSNLNFDQIIKAYEYVYDNRKLYNDTNGEKGAFVVTTNASFGVDYFSQLHGDELDIDDNPLFAPWCEIFNMLGAEGVLNVSACTNKSYDVDELGDMPSICSSEHLLLVTESNQAHMIERGFGKTRVDLSAPGQGSPSTGGNGTYATIGFTSAASPHVAGGIALLYSLPCEGFAQVALDNPATASLLMQSFIVDGVELVDDQTDKTVTSGRLDLAKSMELINEYCGGDNIGLLNIDMLSPNPTNDYIDVAFTPNEYGKFSIEIFNAVGQRMMESEYEAVQFLPTTFRIKDVSEFKTGVYFLRISNNLDYTTSKFVIYK